MHVVRALYVDPNHKVITTLGLRVKGKVLEVRVKVGLEVGLEVGVEVGVGVRVQS